jgi:2-desacetyl-2-hydroxyethyl bacteriochlorophyllide A dehydrogenase
MIKRKVLCFPEKEKAILVEEELSEELKEGEILVKNLKTLISPGTELALYTGTHVGFRDPNNLWAKYPHYPGYISVGEVIKVGERVTTVNEGDIILSDLNHCSYGKLQSSNPLIIRLPSDSDLDTMLFSRMAAISFTAVISAEYTLGDNVAVLGLGLVGNLCSQLFKLSGTNVYGVEIKPSCIEKARDVGIDHVVLGGETREVKERLLKETKGLGFDIVVEATGVSELVNQALELVKEGGQVILLGSTRGDVNVDVYTYIHRKGITVKGAHANILNFPKIAGRIGGTRGAIIKMIDLINTGKLNVKPIITHRISPELAIEAYQWLMDKKSDALGIIINWW